MKLKLTIKQQQLIRRKWEIILIFGNSFRGQNVLSAQGNIFVVYSDIVGVARYYRNYPFVLCSRS